MKKIVIICVNYHNSQEVISYVNEVYEQSVINDIDIVVVDNSNNEIEYNNLKLNLSEDLYLYNPHENLGYINGINYGFMKYTEKNPMPEWVIISNTDINYENNYFYETLLTNYPFGYNCMIAPSIYSIEAKHYQNPLVINRFSKFKMFLLTYIYRYTIIERCFECINRVKNRFQERKNSLLENQEIYTGHGACLIINKCYFEKGGNLNYGSFLFGEELYIAEMIKNIHGLVYFDNRLKLNHNEHRSINKEKRKQINQYYYNSMEYLYKKFY